MTDCSSAPSSKPWNTWIPGVLSRQQVSTLIDHKYIIDSCSSLLDNSSLDLRLANQAYEMVQGSVKPSGKDYLENLLQDNLVKELKPQSDGKFNLSVRKTYLFPLKENIGPLAKSGIYGQATAKSSIGRMDVLARLIVDGMDIYESFDHDSLETGNMYVEVTPMTFEVAVKPDIRLIQLRFFLGGGRPEDSIIHSDALFRSVLTDSDKNDGSLSVDLTPVDIWGRRACAFRAKRIQNQHKPIALWKTTGQPGINPKPYWKLEQSDHNRRLKIEQNHFYIMRSKEKNSCATRSRSLLSSNR